MALAASVWRAVSPSAAACLPTDSRLAARRLAFALCLALGARPTNLAGVRLSTRDSVRAIDLEIDRLRRAGASFATVEAYEHWRNTSVDFLFVENRLRQARRNGRRTTSLRIGWVHALIFCLLARATASRPRTQRWVGGEIEAPPAGDDCLRGRLALPRLPRAGSGIWACRV